jgi:hypothetical protein
MWVVKVNFSLLEFKLTSKFLSALQYFQYKCCEFCKILYEEHAIGDFLIVILYLLKLSSTVSRWWHNLRNSDTSVIGVGIRCHSSLNGT